MLGRARAVGRLPYLCLPMPDDSIIITPEQIPDLALAWKQAYDHGRSERAPSLVERLRNRLRHRYFRRLARTFVAGTRTGPDGRIDGATIRRILLVRYDALGDYICSTGLITWLRAAVPDAEIDMITSPRNDSVARIDPNLTETFAVDYQFRQVRASTLEPLRRAREKDYDVVLGLAMTRMSKLASLSAYVAPLAEKVALLHRERAHIYGEVFTWQVERIGWVDHWANSFTRTASETIAPLGPTPPLPIAPYIVLGEEAWSATEQFMRSEGLGFIGFGERVLRGKGWSGPAPEPFDGTRYSVLNISAFGVERQWAPERAAEVARSIVERRPEEILYITGVPAEMAQVDAAVTAVGDARCRRLSLPLQQFFCVLASAALVVSPDTATVHIAAAHGRPVVGLYGEKVKVAEWHPIGTEFVLVLSHDERTINVIPTARVLEAIDLLERRLARSRP